MTLSRAGLMEARAARGPLVLVASRRPAVASVAPTSPGGLVGLFTSFALFPEDVPVPRGFFDLLASSVFGAKGKRPQMKVRSWP